MINFTSTRDDQLCLTAAEVIARGLSADGGLFVPTTFPQLQAEDYLTANYEKLAVRVLGKFQTEFGQLADSIRAAYKDALPVSLRTLTEKTAVLELFHGRSSAFKDVALQLLPYLMRESLQLTGESRQAVVLTATSGDTGSAAMSGFANVVGTQVLVFYPNEGISETQRLQMTTQSADNVHAIAVRGNFDDAQKAVKAVFQDLEFAREFAAHHFFTSANSINFGRLAPQIVYYIWLYGELLRSGKIEQGEKVNFTVPTGNFGNILAAFYAKQMGLPIGKLICATNRNSVLYDVLTTGVYDRNRDFYQTTSPSMDILVSSNFERLGYHYGGCELVKATQEQLSADGRYELPADILKKMQQDFAAVTLDDAATAAVIKEVYLEQGYVLDPHTAVAYGAMKKAALPGYNVVVATASPYKFLETVEAALGEKLAIDACPSNLTSLTDRPIRQTRVIDKTAVAATIREILR